MPTARIIEVTTASTRTALLLGVVVLSLGAVAAALWTQHALGMEPCPWCVLQRLIFVAMALVALPGLVWRRAIVQQVAALLVLGLGLSGIAAALWQHFVAAASDSCKLTLAERIISGLGLDGSLPEIFQPRASCADAAVKLLGLPYEFWSLMLFVLLGAMALRLLLLRGSAR
jgi:disulfide bond formation protein DsbB